MQTTFDVALATLTNEAQQNLHALFTACQVANLHVPCACQQPLTGTVKIDVAVKLVLPGILPLEFETTQMLIKYTTKITIIQIQVVNSAKEEFYFTFDHKKTWKVQAKGDTSFKIAATKVTSLHMLPFGDLFGLHELNLLQFTQDEPIDVEMEVYYPFYLQQQGWKADHITCIFSSNFPTMRVESVFLPRELSINTLHITPREYSMHSIVRKARCAFHVYLPQQTTGMGKFQNILAAKASDLAPPKSQYTKQVIPDAVLQLPAIASTYSCDLQVNDGIISTAKFRSLTGLKVDHPIFTPNSHYSNTYADWFRWVQQSFDLPGLLSLSQMSQSTLQNVSLREWIASMSWMLPHYIDKGFNNMTMKSIKLISITDTFNYEARVANDLPKLSNSTIKEPVVVMPMTVNAIQNNGFLKYFDNVVIQFDIVQKGWRSFSKMFTTREYRDVLFVF